MTTEYIGSLSIGVALPGPVLAISVALPNLQAQITALLGFEASINMPSFSADLALAGQIVANVEASIALGLTPPSISFQVAAVVALLADLQAQLAIVLGITNLFVEAGIHAYHYAGQAGNLGGDMTTELASGVPGGTGATEACDALILCTTIGATWGAMQTIFKTAP